MRYTDQNRTNKQKDVLNVVTHPTWKVLDVLPVDINCKHCSKIGHFSHLCFNKKQEGTYKKVQETQWHTNNKLEGTLQRIPWITKKIQMSVKVKTLSVYKCRLRNHKLIKKVVTHNT